MAGRQLGSTSSAPEHRGGVFVSYSHADKKWLARLRVYLKPLERDFGVTIWADTALRSGQKWRREIRNAIERCQAALLLVSPSFLASDFIKTKELRPLLVAADRNGVVIIPVILSAVPMRLYPLAKYQAANPLSRPLDGMPRANQDRVFVKVTDDIIDALGCLKSAAVGVAVVDQMYDEVLAARDKRAAVQKRHRVLVQGVGAKLVAQPRVGKPLKVITAKDMRKLPRSTRAYLAVYERGMRDSLRRWKAAYPKLRYMRDEEKRDARISALLRPMKKDLDGILGFLARQGMLLDDHYREFRDLVHKA